jgi:hypothetical protein
MLYVSYLLESPPPPYSRLSPPDQYKPLGKCALPWRGGLNWVPSNRGKFYKHSYGWAAAERLFTSSNSRLLANLSVTFKHGPVGDEWVLT